MHDLNKFKFKLCFPSFYVHLYLLQSAYGVDIILIGQSELVGKTYQLSLTHYFSIFLGKNVHIRSQIQHDFIHVIPSNICFHIKLSTNALFLADMTYIPFWQRS
jgi:hypothetical protein